MTMVRPDKLSWQGCIDLSRDYQRLREYLMARLVHLTKNDDRVALSAIELLLSASIADAAGDVLDDDKELAGLAQGLLAEFDGSGA